VCVRMRRAATEQGFTRVKWDTSRVKCYTRTEVGHFTLSTHRHSASTSRYDKNLSTFFNGCSGGRELLLLGVLWTKWS